MNDYQQLMLEESRELSPSEVQALSEPWECSSESDQELLDEVLEVVQ